MSTAEYRQNLNTLCRAIRNGHAALMECHNHETGAVIWAICATNLLNDGHLECVPIARILEKNPGVVVIPAQSQPGHPGLN